MYLIDIYTRLWQNYIINMWHYFFITLTIQRSTTKNCKGGRPRFDYNNSFEFILFYF
jgi:hypothetical protein